MENIVWENDLFYCSHLGEHPKDDADVWAFTVKHSDTASGLAGYLRQGVFFNEVNGTMRTYMVRDQDTDECAAYFSLKAGLVSLQEHKISEDESDFDTLPGVEVAFYALNEQYAREKDGLGAMIFEDIIEPVIRLAAKSIGIYLIYVYALPVSKLIRNYQENYGLLRLSPEAEKDLHTRLRPRADRDCIFMYKLAHAH